MITRTPVQNRTSGSDFGCPGRYNWDTSETAPRRCVNTVNPGGLADPRSRLMSHSSTLARRHGTTQMGGSR